jgi:hypothetical protein
VYAIGIELAPLYTFRLVNNEISKNRP